MELEEDQIVQCTVEKIIGTTVFVKIQDEDEEATIVTSEISPGRIRNLRDYVRPGKKIVCKILSIKGKNIHLSLRRVKVNEKKEFLENLAKEKSFKAIIKTVNKQEAEKIIDSITQEFELIDFFQQVKEKPKLLEKYFSKPDSEKIMKILESKKEKPKEIKQIFKLSNKSSDGINIIKQIIKSSCKEKICRIIYIAAGTYKIYNQGENIKEIQKQLDNILENIEKQAKKQHCEFELLKK